VGNTILLGIIGKYPKLIGGKVTVDSKFESIPCMHYATTSNEGIRELMLHPYDKC